MKIKSLLIAIVSGLAMLFAFTNLNMLMNVPNGFPFNMVIHRLIYMDLATIIIILIITFVIYKVGTIAEEKGYL